MICQAASLGLHFPPDEVEIRSKDGVFVVLQVGG
jgi:hypothetical protein